MGLGRVLPESRWIILWLLLPIMSAYFFYSCREDVDESIFVLWLCLFVTSLL